MAQSPAAANRQKLFHCRAVGRMVQDRLDPGRQIGNVQFIRAALRSPQSTRGIPGQKTLCRASTVQPRPQSLAPHPGDAPRIGPRSRQTRPPENASIIAIRYRSNAHRLPAITKPARSVQPTLANAQNRGDNRQKPLHSLAGITRPSLAGFNAPRDTTPTTRNSKRRPSMPGEMRCSILN